ncbi:hypothetical protein L596_029160 [Steinernema carpocapsae]|uniref:Major facilitator superfamily (MFS) profile domain-containing protein n=1 Tax=Steinernema carpocapsae TaxID=34508 RepID=A0A4U5LTU7_STECR|nr:hypothetical protein L596_029160 [Steinernema carpocapsae]
MMPISGFFCSSALGWEGSYYFMGGATVAGFVLFHFAYRNTNGIQKVVPKELSTPVELKSESCLKQFDQGEVTISEPQNGKRTQKLGKRLYCKMLASPSFWGIAIVAFGDTIGYQLFLLYGPIYINKVLGFEVRETGLLSAIPHICSITTKSLGGFFLDRATCFKERLRYMLFISVSQAAMTVCFFILTHITAEMAVIGQTMLTLITVFSGLAFIGLMSASQIIS